MDGFETALQLLPGRCLELCRKSAPRSTEEFRLRTGRRLSFVHAGREICLDGDPITECELMRTLEKATGASLHTAASSLARGYISYRGLRVGVCGTAVMQGGELKGFRDFSSLAVRIPHECRGDCDAAIRELYGEGFQNTLLLSPPGGGKTTALRELIRRLSDSGTRVGVVDERNELSACDGAGAQFDLGAFSDVLVGCPKTEGAMMLLRGMNPQIIAMDEITQNKDLRTVSEICGCGVGILASAHAAELGDLEKRSLYRELLALGVFRRVLEIRIESGRRSYTVRRPGE